MQIITRKLAVFLIGLMLFPLFGCAGTTVPQVFMRPEFNKEYVNKVAVLPFEDIANNPTMARRCRQITITQILASGLFEVVDKMQVDSVLKQEAIQFDTPINASTLRRLGQLLDVQAFLVGSLDEAGYIHKGAADYLDISMTMRLLDAESGLVLWQASGRNSGYSWWDRLFGVGGKDSFQVTQELVRDLLRTIR
jgi:TolB-like protein